MERGVGSLFRHPTMDHYVLTRDMIYEQALATRKDTDSSQVFSLLASLYYNQHAKFVLACILT